MKPLPPWFAQALDQLLTDAYLRGKEDERREAKNEKKNILQKMAQNKENKLDRNFDPHQTTF